MPLWVRLEKHVGRHMHDWNLRLDLGYPPPPGGLRKRRFVSDIKQIIANNVLASVPPGGLDCIMVYIGHHGRIFIHRNSTYTGAEGEMCMCGHVGIVGACDSDVHVLSSHRPVRDRNKLALNPNSWGAPGSLHR